MKRRLPCSTKSSIASGGSDCANRTGVNTGEVVSGDQPPASDSSPATRSTSRRASSRRRGAEVLIGELTYKLVRDAVEVEAVEPLE